MSIYQVSASAHILGPSAEKNTHSYSEANSCRHTEQKSSWQWSRAFSLMRPM